ncbi:ScbA/BarX family gamma-butyrolactone biosynthesis protein [Streptomyces sp. AD681]|uniref:ScbA/BarX family gamma-butyrolactone biosynthesis protein n=1 Tax=Streptomyces sp. AD681 TaxID=3019069 RepID=UPI0022F17166|nr:ScbA/BarX family gamma-butyrolactone biosynthesis protein [Streptomyces sp. AD681]MDA5145933.1 ScbA/BarX family gamma-butyrolactone biosynthesis protein [Streptomyces sp. AD681]
MLGTDNRPGPVEPTLTTTVAKEYVHRAALAEVFLTGWTRTGANSFLVSAQWPRSHSFYSSEHGVHDPMLLCESLRQCGLLLTHAAFKVPFGYQLSWSSLRYSANPEAMRIGSAPAEIEMHVQCTEIRYRRSLPVAMTMRIEVVLDAALLAVATITFGQHAPSVYRRLRAGRSDAAGLCANAPTPAAPIPAYVAGRTRREDVVLSPTEDQLRWLLRVDTNHPVLFDHPVDHVPGMLLLESVRQAGHAMHPSGGGMMPTLMDVSFNRYVEFDEPCWIEAEAMSSTGCSRRATRVTALQGGKLAFTAVTQMTDITGYPLG